MYAIRSYYVEKVKRTNMRSRSIGLGVMGEAQMLAELGIHWGSQEHFDKVDEVMEAVSYNAIKASSDLAVEKGAYPEFAGSKWSRGIMPMDHANAEVLNLVDRGGLFRSNYDWNSLRKSVSYNFV